VQLVQETKNLVRLTRFGMVNCFLVREDDGFTLIDTGVAASAPGIRKAAQKFGRANPAYPSHARSYRSRGILGRARR